jgi:hypothetical protein
MSRVLKPSMKWMWLPALFAAILVWIAVQQHTRTGSFSGSISPLIFGLIIVFLPLYLLTANRLEISDEGVRIVMPLWRVRFIPFKSIVTSQLSTGRHAPHTLNLFDRRPSMRVKPFCTITLAIYSREDALWLVDLPDMNLDKWV